MAQTLAGRRDTDDRALFYQVYLKTTPALAAFRRTLGKANYDLNTVRAALSELKKLPSPPLVRFAVKWEPKDLTHDAEEAERFAIKSLLVYAVDALDRYMIDLARSPSIVRDDSVRSILRGDFQNTPSSTPASPKDVTALSSALSADPTRFEELLKTFRESHLPKSRRPGMRTRFDALMLLCPTVPHHHHAAVHILVSWRNRYVHGASNDGVAASLRFAWRSALLELKRTNPKADGAGLLDRFEAGQVPTPDDVTTLIALLHRTAAAADTDLIRSADAEGYAYATFAKAYRDLPAPGEFAKAMWGRTEASRANKFLAMTIVGGFHRVARTKVPKGANVVRDETWWRLARLERATFLAEMDRTPKE